MQAALNERDARYLESAFGRLNICDATRQTIGCTHREVEFDITLELASGEMASFRGFRIQHDRSLGPFKGGIRYHPDVTRDHLRELAASMTWKTALHDLPLGGAKGGVNCDPGSLEKQDLRSITRLYVEKVGNLVGPERDIPAPDIGTNEETMAWVHDAFGAQHGDRPGVVTGKPLALHGTYGRREATGEGTALAAGVAAERAGMELAGSRVAVQGFGSVGSYAAMKEERDRARGERVPVAETAAGGDEVMVDELLELDVDILIPAAIEYVITSDNVSRVKARLIVEGANLPATADASEALEEREAAERDDCGYRQDAFNIAVDAINTAISYRGV